MGEFRYPQFCPFARAAEILAPRWTILILRNLAGGPQRFSDLRIGLQGISSSTLSQRLEALTEHGLIARRTLPPPAAAEVYELTEVGRALTPAMIELARFGARFMEPPQEGDQVEASWARSALVLFKRWEASPPVALEIRIEEGGGEALAVTVRGGPDGTSVENLADAPVDARLGTDPATLLGALLGHFPVGDAVTDGRIRLEGDATAAARLPDLFDLDRRRLGLPSDAPETPSP